MGRGAESHTLNETEVRVQSLAGSECCVLEQDTSPAYASVDSAE